MPKSDIYGLQEASIAQRVTLTSIVGVCVVMTWWLLFGSGLEAIGAWSGRSFQLGDRERSLYLAAALTVYYIRLLCTNFVFLKRGISWGEAFMVASWAFCIYVLLTPAGGTNRESFGAAGFLGVTLFAVGSWMNSYAEYGRHVWKQKPENRGQLYTLGLFHYSRHPNYFGDVLSFSGLCAISGRWITIVIPVVMLAGFIFVNIPMLDSHLHEKYGASFEEYSRRTRKLIPFVY